MTTNPRPRIRTFALALTLTALTATTLLTTPTPAFSDDPDFTGSWQGTLKVSGVVELLLVMHFEQGDEGLTGTMDSPDQGVRAIPLSMVATEGYRIIAQVASIGGEFAGALDPDSGNIVGVWSQGGMELRLELERAGEEAMEAPKRPQAPPDDVPYRREEVSYAGGEDGVTLAGTLTIPEGEGPFPAVLLITGSGPQDRDEALLGHRPFAVLAHHLTSRGVAVLRADDRGVGESTGDFAYATTEDFAADALAGFRFLRGRAETADSRVGLLGHSEGGIVAPMVAAEEPAVAFLVLLASPGVTGDQLLYRQGEELARAGGADDAAVQQQRALQERLFQAARGAEDGKEAVDRVTAVVQSVLAGVPREQREQVQAVLEAQSQQVTTPWFRYFLSHDPVPVLAKVERPILALWAEKDLQVPPDQNRPPLEAAVAIKELWTAQVFPGLNHLFQTAESGHPTEYGRIEETISPAVLKAISDWIAQQGK